MDSETNGEQSVKRYEAFIANGVFEIRESVDGKWIDLDEVTETFRIAAEELAAVEREIGIPSKALPMLRTALGKEVSK
jgi:hypothetical protein